MHVHHPRRGAVLWSRQLWAVLLIFALLLVLVLLQRVKKNSVQTHNSSVQKQSTRNNAMYKKNPQQNKNAGALTACSKRECITENIFALENKRLDVFFCLPAPVDSRWRRRGFQVTFIMTVNIIKEGARTHVIWFGLRHRHPLVDAEGRVSNSHPFLLPVQEQKPKPTQRKTTRPHDRSYYSQDI